MSVITRAFSIPMQPLLFFSPKTATMETFTYTQFPSDVSSVHIGLFRNVTNAAQLRQRLISAATMPGPEGEQERAAVNFTFIDARLVCVFPSHVNAGYS